MDEKDGNYQNMWPTHCISCMDEKDGNYQSMWPTHCISCMDEKDDNYQSVWPTHCISCMDEKDDNYQVCGRHTVSVVWTRKTIIIKYVAYILYQAHGGDRL